MVTSDGIGAREFSTADIAGPLVGVGDCRIGRGTMSRHRADEIERIVREVLADDGDLRAPLDRLQPAAPACGSAGCGGRRAATWSSLAGW